MRLGKLVKDAQSLAKDGQLDPCNLVQRCHFSAIFSPLELDDPKLAALSPLHVDLPESIYQNIRVLRCSLATKDLFIPPCKSSSFQEHNLNSIVSAIYAIHGRRQIKHKGSELSHIVKPVSIFLEPFFSAHDDVQIEWDTMSMAYKNVNDCEKLRPDIILHTICNDMIVEVGNGEVKKERVAQSDIVDARARVREVCERLLHMRLRHAHKPNEAVTFGIGVFDTIVEMLPMRIVDDVYVCFEFPSFVLPSSVDTISSIETAMEATSAFKHHTVASLRDTEGDEEDVWEAIKANLRPTSASHKSQYFKY